MVADDIRSDTRALADRVWAAWVERAPSIQLHAVNASHVPSRSLAEAEQTAASADTFLAELSALRARGSDPESAVTLDYLAWLLETWRGAPQRHLYEFAVSPYTSSDHLVDSVRAFETFSFESGTDVDRYLDLVESYRHYVDGLVDTLRYQSQHGVHVPRPAHDSVLSTIAGMRELSTAAMRVAPQRLAALSAADRGRVTDRVELAIVHGVVQAFSSVVDFVCGSYADKEPAGLGFAQYPGGEQYYRDAAALWTTSSKSIETMHQIGLDQVAELTGRLEAVRRDLGYSGSHRDFMTVLKKRPRMVGTSAADIRSVYHRRVERALPSLQPMFAKLPQAPWSVERLDPALEPGMTFGYYSYPTPSNSIGTYYFNGSDPGSKLLIGAQALMLHEILPGHHLQMGLQVENSDLPAVRREPVLSISAFVEGWGEYAAGLGWELGLYEEPLDQYGRLANELFLSQRLVLDTGLNAFGWTYDRAFDYLREGTTHSDRDIHSEILRYSADFPAQALAYRLGHLELVEMRERATSALGDAFDLRGFHALILDAGALPLSVVSTNVDRWIVQRDQR